MVFNITSIKTSSDGVWQGDNPLHYAFPLLIVQTTLVIFISRLLSFFLKPLRQPKVIAEILGGILLGPSALGQYKEFTQWVFPSWSTPILESVASVGLLFFLFLVGLELDLTSIRRSGRRALWIASSGILLPFLFGIGITFLLRKTVVGADKVGFAQCFLFMGVSLSITAFPVLARILAELKLLTTQVGETAMAAAAFNDIAAWVLLALAVALAGGSHKSPLVSLWVLMSGAGFVIFMVVAVRPAMEWVASRCSKPGHHDHVEEGFICLTLAGVMISGFMTDLIGIHSIFGAFVFGLMIPKHGEFAGRLIRRIEDFVCGLLLPLYFASSGLKTNVNKIKGAEAWGLLAVVISTACTGKILGTFLMGMLCMIPARESLALGLLMNTKGLVELIVLNIGKEKKVLNDEMFAILVMMALVTTFMTTPMVMAVYKPARKITSTIHHRSLRESSSHYLRTLQAELRVLACVHGSKNSSSMINLIDSIQSPNTYSNMKLYILHLLELTERSSSIMMVHKVRKNGVPRINNFREGKSAYKLESAALKESKVKVRSLTTISALPTMHDDICHVADKKRAAIVILPFHRQPQRGYNDEEPAHIGHGWEVVNQRVLSHAPCTVALLVDRGLSRSNPKRVCVVFIGGPDNREALELGGRMAAQPDTKLTIIRFLMKSGENENHTPTKPEDADIDKELDEISIEDFKKRWEGEAEYVEKSTLSIKNELLEIGQSKGFELVIVGRGRFPEALVAGIHEREGQYSTELGLIGGLLASHDHGITSSILVVQKHNLPKEDKDKPCPTSSLSNNTMA
ncbi:cation/H(+) antiporter 20 [Artemisia annua]|uniref:Cation/H(+) antiporter 20 n=1 Tax=Artemisia annua TaxID=35608 RepID=A0A2U1QDQ2_ARTAN|nr:cation/H(+) antiporter 20 [Artemisia annua]